MGYDPSFDHLIPLVEALVDAGNLSISDGFQINQGGADCLMRDPLDLNLVRPLIDTDTHAQQIQADTGAIHCRHCWASILVVSE